MKVTVINLDELESEFVAAPSHRYPVEDSEDKYAYLKLLLFDDSNIFAKIDLATPQLRRNLEKITQQVASLCDRCQTRDEVGFNLADCETGHEVARDGVPEWWDSNRVKGWAQRMFHYRNQLDGNFFEMLFYGGE